MGEIAIKMNLQLKVKEIIEQNISKDARIAYKKHTPKKKSAFTSY